MPERTANRECILEILRRGFSRQTAAPRANVLYFSLLHRVFYTVSLIQKQVRLRPLVGWGEQSVTALWGALKQSPNQTEAERTRGTSERRENATAIAPGQGPARACPHPALSTASRGREPGAAAPRRLHSQPARSPLAGGKASMSLISSV